MKQQFTPKQKLNLTKKYNSSFRNYLNVLSLNNDQLDTFLQELSNDNPYFIYNRAESDAYLEYDHTAVSLYDVIMKQITLNYEHYNEEICEYIIHQVDSNGYFRNDDFFHHPFYSKDEIIQCLEMLRDCEPYGCFAFSLKQCLQLQCIHNDSDIASLAFKCCDYLEEIVEGKIDFVCQKLSVKQEDLMKAFRFIQTLNPKPAANYSSAAVYASPEFLIQVENNEIHIEFLSQDYQFTFNPDEIEKNSEMLRYISTQKKEYENIMNAVKKRNSTLIIVMRIICEHQKDFFLRDGSLHHLTLQDVADESGLHVSTICRAIQNKSFEFKKQYFLLKKMFSHSGTNVSEQEIKNAMKDIIKNENKFMPYSDEKLKEKLEQENIFISRRTIQKYREQCQIPKASLRRKKR